jgi:hypothetical protein
MVNLDGKLEVIKYEDLDGAFKYTAHDLGAGPMAEKESLKEFTAMAMSVMALPGIDKNAVVKAVLERNKLPAEWLQVVAPVPVAPMATSGAPSPDGALPTDAPPVMLPGQ